MGGPVCAVPPATVQIRDNKGWTDMQTVVRRDATDVSLLQIPLLFVRVGLTSFGGGLSAWIYREVVTQRGWLNEEEFLGALTLGHILPGSNVVNLSIYVGYSLKGAIGSAGGRHRVARAAYGGDRDARERISPVCPVCAVLFAAGLVHAAFGATF